MGEVATINYFAAIPGRANRDDRLSGLHFRVLGTIAGHDRMGRNGQCCWAGRNTLAELVGCNPSRLSTAVSDLIAWGYIEEQRHEEDGRRKGYRVVYEATADAAGIGSRVREDRLQDGNLSGGNRLPDRNVSGLKSSHKSLQKQNVKSFQPEPNIFRRNENITQKRGFGDGHKPPDRVLAEWLGSGESAAGWRILAALPDDELRRLRAGYADGSLDPGDLARARSAANPVKMVG